MPPKGERRKQQIINTAKEMFIEKGFQSTHIGQVCEKLSIARGTVYQYFSNKKEILYALLDSVIEKIEDKLDRDDMLDYLEKNPSQEELVEFLKTRFAESLELLISEPIVIKLVFKDIAGIDGEVIKRVEHSIIKIKKILTSEITEMIGRGIYRDDLNPQISASMIMGGVMMLVYEFEKKEENILDADIINYIMNCYFNGALKR